MLITCQTSETSWSDTTFQNFEFLRLNFEFYSFQFILFWNTCAFLFVRQIAQVTFEVYSAEAKHFPLSTKLQLSFILQCFENMLLISIRTKCCVFLCFGWKSFKPSNEADLKRDELKSIKKQFILINSRAGRVAHPINPVEKNFRILIPVWEEANTVPIFSLINLGKQIPLRWILSIKVPEKVL